jgi:eukaryotic-like serine/threonine-protein kinase
MPLGPGTRLGPYEIQSALGSGGMGEVYRARDTRLDRTVAIKVLPAQFSADPLFRDRFEREARAISSLSHSNICALFDVGHQDDTDYLVLEYLEGETLEHRLAKGMLPFEQALQYAGQIASALDSAHRQGIIHRDLKPANIMVTKSGIKVLDFGLAKTGVPAASVGASVLATTPPNLTAHGAILGTFQYMSPEQLEGAEATAQSDIFSFGAVLYEMVTGKRAFEGKSQASLIAAILDREPPPVSASQPLAPPPLDQIVSRCLAKNPEDRWQSAGDLAGQLQWIASSRTRPGVQTPTVSRRLTSARLAWGMVAVVGLLAIALAVPAALYFRQPAAAQEQIRFLVNTPPIPATSNNTVVVSPDGRSIAYVAASGPNTFSLFVRRMGSEVPQLLAGTEGAANPFWSPDSRYIAFATGGQANAPGALLKKIDVSGGPPLTICDWPGGNRAGTWNNESIIVFASNNVLNRVSAAGGRATPISVLDSARGETFHTSPYFLPDGRHYLYTAWSSEQSNRGRDEAAAAERLIQGGLHRWIPPVSARGHSVCAPVRC